MNFRYCRRKKDSWNLLIAGSTEFIRVQWLVLHGIRCILDVDPREVQSTRLPKKEKKTKQTKKQKKEWNGEEWRGKERIKANTVPTKGCILIHGKDLKLLLSLALALALALECAIRAVGQLPESTLAVYLVQRTVAVAYSVGQHNRGLISGMRHGRGPGGHPWPATRYDRQKDKTGTNVARSFVTFRWVFACERHVLLFCHHHKSMCAARIT